MLSLNKIIVFLVFIIWGSPAMSFETGFNQELRERFKKSIGYSRLLEQPPTEKLVIVDWGKTLTKITDKDGQEWIGTLDEPTLDRYGVGELTARLKSSSGMAIVKVTSLSGNWKHRLDYVMWTKSLTNREEVNLRIKPGVSDLYLIPKDHSEITFTTFLYGNFKVDISHWDQQDVSALSEKILSILQSNSHPVEIKNPSPKFSLTADKNRIKVDDRFSIKVKGLVADWNTNWIYSSTENLLPDTLEFSEQDGDALSFKALKSGAANIQITAMNKRNLLLSAQSLNIVVE